MADLTIQTVVLGGLAPTYAAAAAGDTFPNDGRTILHVKNSNAATRTITVESQRPVVPGYAQADNAVVVAATTGDDMIGPFDPNVWNNSTGRCEITYSATTGLTIAAIRIP